MTYGKPTGGSFTLSMGKRTSPPLAFNAPGNVVSAEARKLGLLAAADSHEAQAENLERQAGLWLNRVRRKSDTLRHKARLHRQKAASLWAEVES